MARAGTIEALESDYVRTATLKGLPRWLVIRRHVLRNSLLPTITVIATQTGYLIGGLVVDRGALQLPGHRQAHLHRRQRTRTFRCWRPESSFIGIVYLTATLLADILYTVLEPAGETWRSRMTAAGPGAPSLPDAAPSGVPGARLGRRRRRALDVSLLVGSGASSSASSCARKPSSSGP